MVRIREDKTSKSLTAYDICPVMSTPSKCDAEMMIKKEMKTAFKNLHHSSCVSTLTRKKIMCSLVDRGPKRNISGRMSMF